MRRIKDKSPALADSAARVGSSLHPELPTRRHHARPAQAVILFLVVAVQSAEERTARRTYCSICRDHTMCIFQVSRPLTPAQREEVTAAHNALRWLLAVGEESRGSPGPQRRAANMRFMWYDEELAAIAQRWADQCHFKHDTCRDTERFPVGQNIYLERSTRELSPPNWNLVAGKWYDEVALHSGFQTANPFTFSANTGHFTQMTWADTFLVGCGISEYRENHAGRRWNVRLYVCNYGPAGNLIGGSLYRVGDPCSRCSDQAFCYYGLCA